MASNVIDAAGTGKGSFAIPRGGEQPSFHSLATQQAQDIYRRAQEDAYRRAQEDAEIEEEDILTQAEEAGAFDPIG